MKRIALILLALISATFAASDELEKDFTNPPADARPWVYWFPLAGNLTKEGITADLESMARVGIGGLLMMEVDQGAPKGPVDFAGPQWRELFTHICREAKRLGLQINMTNTGGWSSSGGPWITPELSMQKVVWTETPLTGGQRFTGVLPQPKAETGYYRDIAVLALPVPAAEQSAIPEADIALSASVPASQPTKAGSHAPTFVLPHPETGTALPFVQIAFPKPVGITEIRANLAGFQTVVNGILEASEDGTTFHAVQPFQMRLGKISLRFAPVTARAFRLVFKDIVAKAPGLTVTDLGVSIPYRVDNISNKSFLVAKRDDGAWPALPATFPPIPAEFRVARDQVIDLTAKLDPASGQLTWDAPPGKWVVLRFGGTSTGANVKPPPEAGRGLECDKLNPEAIQLHYKNFISKLVKENRELVGQDKVWVSTHIDSWEIGSQNWTPAMRQEFQKRRGYDLLPLLPVLTGRVIDSVETSERFLWDLRLTVSEMLCDNYVGELQRLAKRDGLRLSIEAYDGIPADNMAAASRCDEPMGEFWSMPRGFYGYSCTEMASTAHLFGKPIVGAEAFTSLAGRWLSHPGNIKELGDLEFCEGINRFDLCFFTAQPWTNVTPGLSMGGFGMHYERTQTWWEQSVAWHRYVTRCQSLLQQGLFVADVAYLNPEGAPRSYGLPADSTLRGVYNGYRMDVCNAEAVLTRMSVRDGRIVLPDGMSYRALAIAPMQTMTLALMRKIRDLANAGATIIATDKPPVKSPSLSDSGTGDAEVEAIGRELWSSGKVLSGKPVTAQLLQLGLKPDFSCADNTRLRFIHRQIGETDVYFVANPDPKAVSTLATFRVAGRQPEFWWPQTGEMRDATMFDQKDGTTTLRLNLESHGSVFVVFRKPVAGADDRIVSITRDGKDATAQAAVDVMRGLISESGDYTLTTASGKSIQQAVDLAPSLELAGPWTVKFDPKWGGPAEPVKFDKLEDWSKRAEPGIKYYSGTARYTAKFTAPVSKSSGTRVYLDLGQVAVTAHVYVNGRDVGIAWRSPFRLDITDALTAGENRLEVDVANLWINRMIGDEQLPPDSDRLPKGGLKSWPDWLLEGKPSPTGRYTFSSAPHWKKDDPLVESGLLGPVKLEIVKGLK